MCVCVCVCVCERERERERERETTSIYKVNLNGKRKISFMRTFEKQYGVANWCGVNYLE